MGLWLKIRDFGFELQGSYSLDLSMDCSGSRVHGYFEVSGLDIRICFSRFQVFGLVNLSRPVVVSLARILTHGLPLTCSHMPRSFTLARSTGHGSRRIRKWVTGKKLFKFKRKSEIEGYDS